MAPHTRVGTAPGQILHSTATGTLNLPMLPPGPARNGHVMPSFKHMLVGIGNLGDSDCTVTFTKTRVDVMDSTGQPVLAGWREPMGS